MNTPHSSLANPNYTVDELTYQLQKTGSRLLFSSIDSLPTARAAADSFGLSHDRIVSFSDVDANGKACKPYSSLRELIIEGMGRERAFEEKILSPGEAKTTIALLCFSSGTTGRPKVGFCQL